MPNQIKAIRTVKGLVRALGGTKAVANHLEIVLPAVSNWLAEDYIPPGWHYRLHCWAEDLGLRVERRMFGVPNRVMPDKGQRPVAH